MVKVTWFLPLARNRTTIAESKLTSSIIRLRTHLDFRFIAQFWRCGKWLLDFLVVWNSFSSLLYEWMGFYLFHSFNSFFFVKNIVRVFKNNLWLFHTLYYITPFGAFVVVFRFMHVIRLYMEFVSFFV